MGCTGNRQMADEGNLRWNTMHMHSDKEHCLILLLHPKRTSLNRARCAHVSASHQGPADNSIQFQSPFIPRGQCTQVSVLGWIKSLAIFKVNTYTVIPFCTVDDNNEHNCREQTYMRILITLINAPLITWNRETLLDSTSFMGIRKLRST